MLIHNPLKDLLNNVFWLVPVVALNTHSTEHATKSYAAGTVAAPTTAVSTESDSSIDDVNATAASCS